MNDLESSLISEFVKLGCTQQNAAMAYQVYTELTEVRRLFDVKYHFENNMKKMYFTAKNSKSEQDSLYFPICTFENVSFAFMKQIFELNNNKSYYFAIISPDSTCVYYQISDGLLEFSSTVPVSKIGLREKHDNELSEKHDEIEKLANLNSNIIPNECTSANISNKEYS